MFRTIAAACLLYAFEAGLGFEPPMLRSTSYLGIGVVAVEDRGVEITRVEDDSPASKAGLKTGDLVQEFNGQRISGSEQFVRLVHETVPGREVKLSVNRAGAVQTITVKTGIRKPLDLQRIEIPDIQIPDIPRAHLSWRSTVAGIEAETLDEQLAEYFGVKEGVLVRSTLRGSNADRAGVRAGDVIVKVDNAKVTTPREISAALRSAQAKRSVTLQLMREKREVSVTMFVDDALPHAMPKRK